MVELTTIRLDGVDLSVTDTLARETIEGLQESLSSVATSGNYADLSGKPVIPSFSVSGTTLVISTV